MAQAKPLLEGNRKFTWFEPVKKGAPSQYENFTLGQQSSPKRGLHVGWPVRFDDGREPFTESSSAIRCSHWEEYRDPAQTWQRPYVAGLNHEQQTIGRLVESTLAEGLAERINPVWSREILGKYLAAWPFVEYGEFLSLCYAVRETLAETITFALAFEAADKMRYAQNLVGLIIQLGDVLPAYSDAEARSAWMSDPILVPIRENVELIFSLADWVEIVVAMDLVFEPIVGTLMKSEFLARNAPYNGDPATPLILASERADARRHLEGALALIAHACGDAVSGSENNRLVRSWLQKWTVKTEAAAQALRGIFELKGIVAEPFERCCERARARQRTALRTIGL
ncbi:MAG: methane/phenol/Toluene hydroxylase [Acidobacteria bacterium]|nr:methane/phenol/Toluene hydroxylase [Acidobacteriota bacterium]